MSSTNKTELGLNQWTLSDKPTMEDFNADNALINQLLTNQQTRAQSTLLVNPYLIINQRGKDNYTIVSDKWTYFADRWRAKTGSGTETITKNLVGGWNIPAGATVQQVVDVEQANIYKGKTAVQASVVNGVFSSEKFTISGVVLFEKTFIYAGTISYGEVVLGESFNNPISSNLDNDFINCQRYYTSKLVDVLVVGRPKPDINRLTVLNGNFMVKMRSTPTVTIYGHQYQSKDYVKNKVFNYITGTSTDLLITWIVSTEYGILSLTESEICSAITNEFINLCGYTADAEIYD